MKLKSEKERENEIHISLTDWANSVSLVDKMFAETKLKMVMGNVAKSHSSFIKCINSREFVV